MQYLKVRSISAQQTGPAVTFKALHKSWWARVPFGDGNSSKLP